MYPEGEHGITDAMLRCMAAARYGVSPGAFARWDIGEQVLAMDADRVMRAMEHRTMVEAMREAVVLVMGKV